MKATPEQNAAYRQGRCIGLCGEKFSPGRPRCDECHAKTALAFIDPELTRRGAERGA